MFGKKTLRAANLVLIDNHQRLPLTAMLGTGPCTRPTWPARNRLADLRTAPSVDRAADILHAVKSRSAVGTNLLGIDRWAQAMIVAAGTSNSRSFSAPSKSAGRNL
ncbi:hypothetical protein ACWDUL_38110 [Nocardia niigatensis]